jgi:FkbM family methyltransferase
LIQKLVPGCELTIVLDDEAVFSVPFADSYWSMLLGGAEIYEPEIEGFLKNISGEKYTLVDCGANYGYWSVLASGKNFGSQRGIAIEPSADTFTVLKKNAALNGDRFACMKMAVGARSGSARLSGSKHEARAVSDSSGGESIEMLTLDSLIDRGDISPGEKIVVKLDVEGQEIAALSGSTRLLDGDCIVICEDHGSDRHHTVSRYILEQTPLKLFCQDVQSARFESIASVAALDRIKRFRNRGYNVFATASPYWQEKLAAAHEFAAGATNSASGRGSATTVGALAIG